MFPELTTKNTYEMIYHMKIVKKTKKLFGSRVDQNVLFGFYGFGCLDFLRFFGGFTGWG
jgi:hypothetical protein